MDGITRRWVSASFFGLIIALGIFGSECIRAQNDAADEKIHLIQTTLQEALLDYEALTGKRVITDFADLEEAVAIDTRGEIPHDEAIVFIEKSLLLNGYVFVPSGEKTVKLIKSANAPRAEGVPIVTREEDLPETDTLVTYVMHFDHVQAADVVASFSSIAPNHTYGAITALPDGKTLAITENTAVIRKYIELQSYVDVPLEEQAVKTVVLERANASEVAEELIDILDLGGSSAGNGGGNASSPQANRNPNVGNVRVNSAENSANQVDGGAGGQRIARDPKIKAIDRTNSILIMAHPAQMSFIESLVTEFDAPALTRNYMTVRLRYKPVLEFLNVAREALSGGDAEGGAGGGSSNSTPSRTATTTQSNPVSNSGFGGDSGFGSNSGLGGASSSGSRGGTSLQATEVGEPQVFVVGETRLIADPASNEIFVSGPPEHLEAIQQLIEHLDKKPRQVYLKTVIGQLTLGENVNFGLDLVREVDQFEIGNELANAAGVLRSRSAGGDNQGILDPRTLTSVASFLPAAQGLALYGTYGDHLNAFVDLLETTSRFKVVQRPSVVCTNNEKAVIQTGQRIAVPSSTLTSLNTGNQGAVTSNIQYQDVVLRLEVVPLINSDDEVSLTISQINDNIIGSTNISGNDIPTIGTQELVTKVIVPNKATVLLGGLISEDSRESRAGIPKLINIPLLKHLAGSKSDAVNRQELLIFIEPHIVQDGADMADANYDLIESTEVIVGSEDIVQPGPLSRLIPKGDETPYSRARPISEVRPVKKRGWPWNKIFRDRN